MESVKEVIEFINDWIEREARYEERANEIGDETLANDCHRRIFTLQLLLNNIE